MLDKSRLEAFSDGVLAVIITIMVLELRVPSGTSFAALESEWPTIVAYVLSFTYLSIYWVNHHHLLKAAEGIGAGVMWANLHLLFWLSFFPFVTAWAGRHPQAPVPTLFYAIVFFAAAVAYTILTTAIAHCNGPASRVAGTLRVDWKQIVSIGSYLLAIAAAFPAPWLSDLCFFAVALLWVVPDQRLERALRGNGPPA